MTRINPDRQKAKALVEMARITFERLKELDILKYPANTLTDYYDILHKLMEAISYSDGIRIKGEGAHQKLIDYISKEYEFSENKRIFLQNLRDYRNRISYEGFSVKQEYIKSNQEKIEEIISKLNNIIKEILK